MSEVLPALRATGLLVVGTRCCLGWRVHASATSAHAVPAPAGVLRWHPARETSDLAHAALGRHLSASLELGTFCRYDPPEPTSWDVRS